MHDKLALYPWYILRINHYKRLIYKSLNIIALFAHFKEIFIYFVTKKEMSSVISVLGVLPLLPSCWDVIDVTPVIASFGWGGLAKEI